MPCSEVKAEKTYIIRSAFTLATFATTQYLSSASLKVNSALLHLHLHSVGASLKACAVYKETGYTTNSAGGRGASARPLATFAPRKLLASLVGQPDRLRRQAHFGAGAPGERRRLRNLTPKAGALPQQRVSANHTATSSTNAAYYTTPRKPCPSVHQYFNLISTLCTCAVVGRPQLSKRTPTDSGVTPQANCDSMPSILIDPSTSIVTIA